MKKHQKPLSVVSFIVAMLVMMSAAFAAPRSARQYYFQPLPGGATQATSISNNGQWVGSSEGFMWNGMGNLVGVFPDFKVFNVNNSGQFTGASKHTHERMYAVPLRNRAMTTWIPIALPGTIINGMNNAGLMVGHTGNWPASPMTLLPGGQPNLYGGFPDLSNHYDIYGVTDYGDMLWLHSWNYSRIDDAYIITAEDQIISLGSDVYPRSMSQKLHVVGTCTRDGDYRNFRWDPTNGMLTLKSFGYGAELNGVNSKGTVIGTSYCDGAGEIGVIWTNPTKNSQGTDLNELLVNGDQFKVIAAYGISENETIAVCGINKANGKEVAGILRKQPVNQRSEVYSGRNR